MSLDNRRQEAHNTGNRPATCGVADAKPQNGPSGSSAHPPVCYFVVPPLLCCLPLVCLAVLWLRSVADHRRGGGWPRDGTVRAAPAPAVGAVSMGRRRRGGEQGATRVAAMFLPLVLALLAILSLFHSPTPVAADDVRTTQFAATAQRDGRVQRGVESDNSFACLASLSLAPLPTVRFSSPLCAAAHRAYHRTFALRSWMAQHVRRVLHGRSEDGARWSVERAARERARTPKIRLV
jgi:hypothetical protein